MFDNWLVRRRRPNAGHHDMVDCLSVAPIQNWHRIVASDFGFDVVFTANDSGKSYLWYTIVHQEPGGIWLIA